MKNIMMSKREITIDMKALEADLMAEVERINAEDGK